MSKKHFHLLSLSTRDGVGLGLCDCADFVAGGFMDGTLNLAGRHVWEGFWLERASIAVALDGAIANSPVLQHAVAGLGEGATVLSPLLSAGAFVKLSLGIEDEVAAGKGSVRALGLVHELHVRLDPALVDQ